MRKQKPIDPFLIVGEITCPICSQKVRIINDEGTEGNPILNYIENHLTKNSLKLCEASEKRISLQ